MKKILLPLFAIGLFTLSGCDEHDHDHGDVTITFLHPTNNEEITMAEAGNVEIHVKFEWEGDAGEAVEVKLIAEVEPEVVIVDFDQHQHDKVFEFEQSYNLSSYPVGTEFHLEAKGCEDHDCDKYREASIHFKLVE